MKRRLLALTLTLAMAVSVLPTVALAAEGTEMVPSQVTTLETGPITKHEPQTFTVDCDSNLVKNVTTGEEISHNFNDIPILFPGDTVRFLPAQYPASEHHQGCKGYHFTEERPEGVRPADSFACKDDGKVHVEVTETHAWGEPNSITHDNRYITAIKIVGDELVKLQSWGGGDYTSEDFYIGDKNIGHVYSAGNLEFVYIPAWCKVTTGFWYSFNTGRPMTEEETATAAWYTDEPSTTVVWAADGIANSVADKQGEDRPILLSLHRPYIEGFRFSGIEKWKKLDTDQPSSVYDKQDGPNWHGNYWEGWTDDVVEYYPRLDSWNGKRTGYCAYGSYDDELLARYIFYPCRTLTLDACGGTIDGYPTRIYEAADCRQYFDEELRSGTVDAQFAAGEKYVPEREGYIFAGWYEDAEYTTPVTSLRETVNKYSSNPYDSLEKHVCRVYAKWMQESQVTLADKTVTWTGAPVAMDGAQVTGSTGEVVYHYFADEACTQEIEPDAVIPVGTYFVKASVAEDDHYLAAESDTARLTIVSPDLGDATIAALAKQTYTGKALKPAPTVTFDMATLTAGTDYKVSYKNNTNAGTATVTVTGKGDYIGTKQATFQIKAAAISKAGAAEIKSQTYTGKALKPAVKLTYGGKTLKSGTDYTAAYASNKKVGTATVTVTGKGNFSGTRKLTFKIGKAANPMTVKGKTATVKYSAVKKKAQTVKAGQAFTVSKAQGKVTYKKTGGDKNITVSSAGKLTVKKGTKKGTHTVKVKVTAAGNGSYKAGSKTVTVTVKVK